jgi:hypothetical protein
MIFNLLNNIIYVFHFHNTDGKLTTRCRTASNDFDPVTEEEFTSVSDLVRGRSKLEDVNQVQILQHTPPTSVYHMKNISFL